ncbi:hypothetical protein IU458_35810 [Nocardia nova]|nr:hypothetical protein [Nocardia nova]
MAELKRLRRENAELKRANAILKAASAFFAVNVMLLAPSGVRSFFRCPSVAMLVACHDVRPRWARPVGFVA